MRWSFAGGSQCSDLTLSVTSIKQLTRLTSEKSDSLGPTLGTRAFSGLFGGCERKQTWRKAEWNVSAGLKQLKIQKKKIHENVKLKEDVPEAILLREKPEKCKSVCCCFGLRWAQKTKPCFATLSSFVFPSAGHLVL